MSATAQHRESMESWETNVPYWDEAIGRDGNKYWKKCQKPCLQRLLADHLQATDKPRRALELACGNGLCSRWLASHGDAIGEVWASDGSRPMLDRAGLHGSMDGKISFHRLDVTDTDAFAPLLQEAASGVSSRRGY